MRILDGAGATGAVTRVLLDATDGERDWTTIGVSTNIIEASWRALEESLVYGLLHAPADGRLTLTATELPVASERRVAVRVTADALRQVRGGHPWVFDRVVTSVGHDGAPGDLAVVFDDRRRFAAIGLYDPTSPIRVRVLHHGDPVAIDADWWYGRVAASMDRRATLAASDRTTGYRVVHGENDGFPGLVVDRYDDDVRRQGVLGGVAARTSARWPMPSARWPARSASCCASAGRAQRAAPAFDGVALSGRCPTEPVLFREEGLTFEADVAARPEDRPLPRPARQPRPRRAPRPRADRARRVRLHGRLLGARRGRWGDGGAQRRPEPAGAGRGAPQHGPQPPARRSCGRAVTTCSPATPSP